MTAQVLNLSVLAYAQGFTLWHYKGTQPPAAALASIEAPGFFNGMADMMNLGDWIMVSALDGARILFVTDTMGDVVTVVPLS